MFVLSKDRVIGLQSVPFSRQIRVSLVTDNCSYDRDSTIYSHLLIEEVFVHHCRNVQQGIAHAEKGVFTERTLFWGAGGVRVIFFTEWLRQYLIVLYYDCWGTRTIVSICQVKLCSDSCMAHHMEFFVIMRFFLTEQMYQKQIWVKCNI